MNATARALLAEAIGTFFFVTIGAGAIVADVYGKGAVGLVGIALAHGLALSIAVSVFGAVSGGHLNPAVTFGLAIARKFAWRDLPAYVVAQLVGGAAAGLLLAATFPPQAAAAAKLGTPNLGLGVDPLAGVAIEAALTFFLLLAVFGTAVSPNAPRVAGFGIGLTVAADILAGGPLTGAAMNPARHFGPAIAGGGFENWWVYWVGPLIGGLIGGLVYRFGFDTVPQEAPARP